MALAENALTTLKAVREFLMMDDVDDPSDGLLETLINEASVAIMAWTAREFAPATTSAARKFAYTGDGMLSLAPYDLRSVTQVRIDSDETAVTTLATTDYKLRPLPAKDGVYTRLHLPNHGGGRIDREVEITGAWGFASVPLDVRRGCNVTVAEWYRRDSAAFTTAYAVPEEQTERPQALPSAVMRQLSHYRRWDM